MNGVWQLFVRDDTGNGLSGFILDWSITFVNQNNYTYEGTKWLVPQQAQQ